MAVRASGYFNNPAFAQAAANLSGLFAPPSGADAAGWATARSKQEEAARLAQLFDLAQAQEFDQQRFDRMGAAAGQWTPNQSYYAVDKDDATKRYGYDQSFRASTENNVRDNQRQAVTSLYGSLAPGEIAPAVPEELMGALQLPGLEQRTGLPKALSETEVKGSLIQSLPPELQEAIAFGSTPVENIVTPEGPRIETRLGAIGQQPAPSSPQTVINNGPNGENYGDPGKGLVWARDAEGKIQLDERGAPVAIPFQGGEVWQRQQAAEAASAVGDARSNVKNNIVLEDIDRALTMINDSPLLTTGVGNQITGAVGGTPAYNLNAIIDTVKANVGFDQLQAMRDASPTGGALGQVSEMENRLLQSVLGSLETAQSKPQLEQNLKRLYQVVDEIVNGPADRRAAASGGAPAAPAAPATGGTPEGTIIENDAGQRMIKRNGTWEPYDGR